MLADVLMEMAEMGATVEELLREAGLTDEEIEEALGN